jgi:dienelactone hydrolase
MLRAGVCASILIGLFVATAFWGCGGRSAAKPDPAEVKAYTQRGYVPDQRYETVETRDTWALGAGPVDISVLVPSTPGRYPLVLYMPGLGESAQAGALWRRAWARAGYAVIAAQATKYGPAVWASDRARAGEFYDLAKEAFSAPALAARVQILAETLAEVSRRQKDGRTPALANVDLTRIAIAGFDLGAQTAMVAAGEHVDGVAAPKLPEGVKCVIALSPYADFSGMGMKSNFQPIRLPVLSVTSSLDTDAYGLVTSPAVRRAPFQDMPSGRKYLLLLSIASHSVLAGTAPSAEGNGKGGAQRSEASAEDASMVNDESANPDEERPGRKRRRPDFSAAGRDRTAQHAKEEAQVQAVTTAYLDAIVEDDPVASEWLARNAKRWLGESGELTWK